MTKTTTLQQKGYVNVSKTSTPINIYYEMHGTGPQKVLLVTGLSTPCHAWEKQAEFLSQTEKYTVILFDNRGMGHSDAPWGLYSTSMMAADALVLLDHFDWKKNVHLVGISMGGMISLELVDADPDRFCSLTLTSTTAKRNIPTWKAISTLSKVSLYYKDPMDQVRAIVELIHPPAWLEKPHPEFETNRKFAAHALISRARKSRLQPLHGNIGQTAACLGHYFSDERLAKLKARGLPVLIVTGTIDNLVSPESSYHMQSMLQARLEVFEGSGHAIPEEQFQRYNALLEEHFTAASKL
ncbi:hypothetical protein EC973_002721 [Apophysomyces ossiformis]|uniref:AB hydrolase-1 domain-containing protein n=1 Tax=Apophysomyces ossiformis TaxID=679940 RepID=A0A8H7BI06_9FUNG|nr:hypothetical protein EC973_002721 [Apophysomyces ossiformis]